MKQITLLFSLMFTLYATAQSDCSNSQAVSLSVDGTTTVNSSGVSGTAPASTCNSAFYDASAVSSGDWYTFTPSQDLVVTITAAVPGSVTNDYIASASAYEGSCGNLICVGGDLITVDQAGNLIPVEIQFIASANTAYYIAFDDYYANIPAPDGPLGTTAAFSFDVSTSTNIPTAPNAATNPTPTDGATNVDVVETTDDNGGPIEQVAIQWNEPTTGPTPTGYEVYLGTDQNSLNFLGTAQSDAAGSPINITGMQYDTTYYWEIVPINGPVSATGTQVWSFTTEDNLSNEQFETVNFDFYVNNGQLFLNANQSFDQISIFDLSGKKVMSQELSSNDENVSIQSLASGLYLAKVQIGEQTKTIKFLK